MTSKEKKINASTWYTYSEVAAFLWLSHRAAVDYLVKQWYFPKARVKTGTPKRVVKEIQGQEIIDFKASREKK